MKLKTRKAISKRIKVTGSGKIKRLPVGGRHLKLHKSTARKRRLRGSVIESSARAPWKNIKSTLK